LMWINTGSQRDAMTCLSQAKLNLTGMASHIAIRLLFLGAGAAVGLAPAAPYAAPREAQTLYPVCAFGTVILMAFPGGEEEEPAERPAAACHAARLGERPRLIRTHPKKA
jgi:hypothetical protein